MHERSTFRTDESLLDSSWIPHWALWSSWTCFSEAWSWLQWELLKDTHFQSSEFAGTLLLPPQGHVLAEAGTLHILQRKVLHSYTALVTHMPVSALPDLSTALNKHCLQTHFYTFKSSVASLWFYSFLSEIIIEHFHFFCKIFLSSYSLIQDVWETSSVIMAECHHLVHETLNSLTFELNKPSTLFPMSILRRNMDISLS